jgi:antagonist of KipI
MTARESDRTVFEVLDGGLLSTVQDAGRPDWTHLGVPESGAADSWSLAVANLLIGNGPDDAVVEMTIGGPTLRTVRPVTIGLAGADLGGRVRDGRRLEPDRAHRLAAGDVVTFAGSAADRSPGARAYLAVPGGIDVELVLGSRSTCLAAGFGGFDGRPLGSGDRLLAVRPDTPSELVWPRPSPRAPDGAVALRVLVDATADGAKLTAPDWLVAPSSDRVGVRLSGPALAGGTAAGATHGVTTGTIQLPPDGQPIILGPDHQTTGGYQVVGVVISADLPVLGQLAPGMRVRLVEVSRAAAVAALRERRDTLLAGAVALRDADAWESLAHSAGG